MGDDQLHISLLEHPLPTLTFHPVALIQTAVATMMSFATPAMAVWAHSSFMFHLFFLGYLSLTPN
jgi:hypothetical protein